MEISIKIFLIEKFMDVNIRSHWIFIKLRPFCSYKNKLIKRLTNIVIKPKQNKI